jgi:hypothetical protein
MPARSAASISEGALPTPENTEAAALPREQVCHGEVRVRLHRVAHKMRRAGERRRERAVGALDRRARVDVAGRAERFGDRGERRPLGVEFRADACERGHGLRPPGSRGAVASSGVAAGAEGAEGEAPVDEGSVAPCDAGGEALAAGAGGGSFSGPLIPHPASDSAASARPATATTTRPRSEAANSRNIGEAS